MRLRQGILLTIVFSALMGFLAAYITDHSKTDLFLIVPLFTGLVTGTGLLFVLRWSQIVKRRSRILMALLAGFIVLISYENFRYQGFLERSWQNSESSLSQTEYYRLVEDYLKKETGLPGVLGYLAFRANNTSYFVTIVGKASGNDHEEAASPLQIWGNIALEALFLVGFPFAVVWFGSRSGVDDIQLESITAKAKPLAWFRNPRNEAATETFRNKNWPLLTDMVYAGSAPALPALEIHQSSSTDPITGNYYLYLVERTKDAKSIILKTLPVKNADIEKFLGTLQTGNS